MSTSGLHMFTHLHTRAQTHTQKLKSTWTIPEKLYQRLSNDVNTYTHDCLNKSTCVNYFKIKRMPYKNYTQIPAFFFLMKTSLSNTRTALGNRTFAHLTLSKRHVNLLVYFHALFESIKWTPIDQLIQV